MYGSNHVLLRMLGWFGPDANTMVEEWGVGFRIPIPSGTLSENSKIAFLDTVQGACNTFHVNTQVSAGTRTWLKELTAAYIGPDGKYVGGKDQDTTHRPYPTPPAGITNSGIPWDVACVYSLRTDFSRGRGSKGRFYYPCQEMVGLSDGRWAQVSTAGKATAGKLLIDGINSAAKAIWAASEGVSVMSPIDGSHAPVRQVWVGRAPDTQRRRTKWLDESYEKVLVAGAFEAQEARKERSYV